MDRPPPPARLYGGARSHPSGDVALRIVAQALNVACSERSRVARLGGEEFGIVFLGRDRNDLLDVGRRLCRAVEACAVPHAWSDVAALVTISAGIAASKMNNSRQQCAKLFSRANTALYEAKRAGHNRISVTVDADERRGARGLRYRPVPASADRSA